MNPARVRPSSTDLTPVSTATAWIDAANRRDESQLVALSNSDIEIIGPRGSMRGVAALGPWLQRAGLTLENRRIFVLGSHVVIEQRGVWRAIASGEVVGQADVASRFEVREGKVTLVQRHDRLDEALAAGGLSECDVKA